MTRPSARHETSKTSTRFIIVKETREISKGRGRDGQEYSMWQLIATLPDGTAIEQNLRSFEDMPRGEVLEVSVTPFVSEQWGTSYTVARKNKSKLHGDLEELATRVKRIEDFLGVALTGDESPGIEQHRGPPPPPDSTPSTPPPPPTITERRAGEDNGDIPF